MNNRNIREFERLLYRTENLNDTDDIKTNVIIIESKLTELRNMNLLNQNQEYEYNRIITSINSKIAPKTPTKRRKTESINEEEISLAEEKNKQSKLTEEFMKLTEKLKEKVVEVGVALKDDQDVVDNVHKSLDKNVANSENVQTNLDERTKERIGWRAYWWLAKVVIVYLVVSFLFT